MLQNVLNAVDSRREQAVEGLSAFLRIPSVSTKPEHNADTRRCAEWLSGQLQQACGLTTEIAQTSGHPVVIAKNEHRPGRPTVLVYGHYDVQPPEPLEQWTTPPFEPAVRDGAIFARGACDDKGQVWAHVEALRAWNSAAAGGAPVNLTLLIEGEEEIGSIHLGEFVRSRKDDLRADVAVISDTSVYAPGIPAITYGLRGLVYMEVKITGPAFDLHSGIYGGAVANPANVLCELLATLHDKQGRVNIDGFYDDVVPLTKAEREEWAKLPFDAEAYRNELGAPALAGEAGYTPLEHTWARPTCDINGLTAGYQGHGAKTVIGATASAKVSMRLVPNQDPEKIRQAFERTLRARCPKSVKLDIEAHSGAGPVLVPREGRAMQLAAEAVKIGYGKPPALIRSGGSIPVVALFRQTLNIDSLLVGFAYPDDRAHSPNERFALDALHQGSRTCAALYEQLSRLSD
jgi:acetylornithine deacetylase/succinyl-diaminopimelate desuccinylase-like protein